MDADHHTIAKFSSPMDPNYVLVANLLKQIARDIPNPTGKQELWFTSIQCSDSTYIERIKSQRENSNNESHSRTFAKMFGLQGNIQDDLKKHLSQAHPGSYRWFLDSQSFNEWIQNSGSHNSILWLTGLPGTGKSTMAAKILDNAQSSISCQFYFLAEAHPTKRNAAYCLKVLAYQLAIEHPALAERLLQLYHDTDYTSISHNFSFVWETIFENIILQMDFGSTLHWIIDGLDEADTPAILARHLIQMKSKTSIKILLLSRPIRELTNIVGSRPISVVIQPISIEHTRADIRDFIQSAASEVLPQECHFRDRIVDKIANRAEGSFLWTKLALDSLRNSWHTKEDIEKVLETIPGDMTTIYGRMISKVKSQPARLHDIALRVLTWTACAFHPLTIAELDSALRPEFVGFVNLGETVNQICGQLVRVDQENISFIHSTARQFLLHSFDGKPAVIKLYAGHEHLARVCLQYLCQESWRKILQQVSEVRLSTDHDRLDQLHSEFPFWRYATNYWAYHVRYASVDSPELLSSLRRFCKCYMLQWIQTVALSSNMAVVPRSAQYLKRWLHERRKMVSLGLNIEESAFINDWVTDLIRVVGKFGKSLIQNPSTIQRHIPPFCPQTSAIYKTYYNQENPLLTVQGTASATWGDNLARLSVGQDEIASVIRCGTVYFFTLVSHNGTVIVWYKETCEELRRLCHNEWVMVMEMNQTGSLVATGGQYTYRIWDPSNGQQLHVLEKHNQARPLSLGFSQADSELLVGYDDCLVFSYSIEQSKSPKQLFQAPDQKLSLGGCARIVSLSPDHTKVAFGFLGRPVIIWEFGAASRPMSRSVIRMGDKNLTENGQDAYISPDIVRWAPDSCTVYILYQDAEIVAWDLIDETQAEFSQTKAREMTLSVDGTLLLTSASDGSVSVWSLPKFNLVYQLHSDEFVRDLDFSPDAQRIYDVRGLGCNVWAPDALARPDESEGEHTTSGHDGSSLSGLPSEPIIAEDHALKGRVTALTSDSEDEFFCCGRDDGSVTIHDMVSGTRVRKVCNHFATDIVAIEWSASRRFIASADTTSKVIVKRLRIKENGKWAVYPLLDFRVGEPVSQILFSQNEALLLISSETTDHLWDIKKKTKVCQRRHTSMSLWKWFSHPVEESQLIRLSTTRVILYQWDGLTAVTEDIEMTTQSSQVSHNLIHEPEIPSSNSPNPSEKIGSIVQADDRRFMLYEILPTRSFNRCHAEIRIELMDMKDIDPGQIASPDNPPKRTSLSRLARESWRLLGSVRQRVVFLDHNNWICTCNSYGETESLRRHFFLPQDWVNNAPLQVMRLTSQGTLLCARNGEVAIVRYLKGF